jgi:hypothetical protein
MAFNTVPFIPPVKIKLTGVRRRDEAKANRAAGLASTPSGYTWHHHEVPGIMQLVDSKVHRSIGHEGGAFFWTILKNVRRYR